MLAHTGPCVPAPCAPVDTDEGVTPVATVEEPPSRPTRVSATDVMCATLVPVNVPSVVWMPCSSTCITSMHTSQNPNPRTPDQIKAPQGPNHSSPRPNCEYRVTKLTLQDDMHCHTSHECMHAVVSKVMISSAPDTE